MKVCGILGCTPSWRSQANTNVDNGELHSATTLEACQAACFNNASCTGIDWDPGNPAGNVCWLGGPWSGDRNENGARGVTHYDLTRICTGQTFCTLYKTVQQDNTKYTFRQRSQKRRFLARNRVI